MLYFLVIWNGNYYINNKLLLIIAIVYSLFVKINLLRLLYQLPIAV